MALMTKKPLQKASAPPKAAKVPVKKTAPQKSVVPPKKAAVKPTPAVAKKAKPKPKPKPIVQAEPKPESPVEIPDSAAAPRVMTHGRRWDLWLSMVGPERALEHICDHVANGGHLKGYCDENIVPYTTVRNWRDADEARQLTYGMAYQDGADVLAEEIIAISDEVEVEAKYKGEEVTLDVSSAAIQRNRLRVDSRKWVASKRNQRKWGDKLELGGSLELTFEQRLDALSSKPVPPHAPMPPGFTGG